MQPLLEMRNIHKAFGATKALQGVDLRVHSGQVHILVGENGAGKSTLMKILTGVHPPDEGEIFFQGRPYAVSNPKEALRAGIAMIYQEFNLALDLPVHANLFLGHELSSFGIMRAQEQQILTRKIFALLEADIDPGAPVRRLGVAQRQLVEIARALSCNAKVIIMDEPTAALSDKETRKLFETIRSLRDQGVGIIYISHYLEEFGEIGDVYTVLRDGEKVGSGDIASATPQDLIQMMVGRKIEELYPRHERVMGDVLLSVRGLRSPNGTENVSLEVRAGEIVGIAGLVGAGRSEMMRALFGLDPAQVDELQIQRVTVIPPTPRKMLRHHVGLLSEDRAGEGLAQTLSVQTNITLSIPKKVSRFGIVSSSKGRELTARLIHDLGIKVESPDQKINQLSGGNQQKVALARLLGAEALVSLLDEPTRGIDVGSKVEIYRLIDALAREGKGVVMVSSYLPELFGMCDSLYVMARGRLSRKYPIHEIDPDGVMALATGLSKGDNSKEDNSNPRVRPVFQNRKN
ncbi:MAG TPA: sugar ABC transporter ATP-binding protein [bacterium]|nr:sugar ABC transporter ATP-binding protein [bacterium]HOL94276.1 sugar ABC transporter ATP-binding protein [bacterium]HPO99134.1 sugar ABC transporter ATP-binding protein [bacterium]HXK94818.1 sugar ABC transporter ATP-binding protein [bacterium]